MSTALERVMRERGDLDCLHEPFMYDYYIHRQTKRLPMFQPEAGHPVSYRDVRETILRRAARGPVFFKDMSYYVMPHLIADTAFCGRIFHAFIVRDPMASIASYHRLDPDLTLVEIGIEAQWQQYRALVAQGICPVVLMAEDVRANPPAVIGAYWRKAGLGPADHAFEWSPDMPQDWRQVAGWHADVTTSHGIAPPDAAARARQAARFAQACKAAPRLQKLLDHHRPFHDRFSDVALHGRT
jgi:hypothetical protein